MSQLFCILVAVSATMEITRATNFKTEWILTSNNTLANTLVHTAGSLTLCGLECLTRVTCTRFCLDVTSALCYVMDDTEKHQVKFENDELKCFDLQSHQTYKWSDADKDVCEAEDGFEIFDGRCMLMVPSAMTFSAARSECLAANARLYHFQSILMDEQPVQSIALKHTIQFPFWVGAEFISSNGGFVWDDGTRLQYDSDVWSTNSNSNSSSGNKHCVQMLSPYRLSTERCDVERPSLCEKDLSLPSFPSSSAYGVTSTTSATVNLKPTSSLSTLSPPSYNSSFLNNSSGQNSGSGSGGIVGVIG